MANNSPSALGPADLAAATPVDRDRYADLLRLFSIGMVAVGHWVVALLTLHGAGAVSTSMPVMLTTWVWQVMALFFFVGGFAHARALRHRPPTGEFVRARMARLLPPAVAMLAIWAALAASLDVSGLATGEFAVGLHRITVPLWFLGVYLLIVLAAPTMMRLHLRFGLWPVVGTLGVATAAVDSVALGGLPLVGYANLLFVWLAVHQLGYGYADGTLLRGGRRLAAALTVGGLAGTVALVFGTSLYPVLMVGLPGNEVANSSPPTLALFTQSLFLIGAALLLRPAGTALVRRPRVWFVVAAGNTMIMTIFCWHLTACYLVQGALLLTGVRLPAADTPMWLLALPGWLTACTLVCAVLVLAFRRFERSRPPASVRTGAAVAGVIAAAVGLFLVSETGLDGLVAWRAETAAGDLPLHASVALGLVAAGVLLLRGRRRLTAEHGA
ncbi:MAG TPA: acyltransferase [Pseudonocardia sp.]|nr:acyltransferase [Pseudonocardia sp.]